MKQRNANWPGLLAVLIAGLLILGLIDRGQDWGGDFASYIMQAQSLVEGKPQAAVDANRFSIEHTTYPFAPVAYPWGYPAMLASVYAALGPDIVALKSVAVACYLTLLCLMAVAFRNTHPAPWLALLVGFFAVNPTLLTFLNKVNSDVPFMLVSTMAVFLIGRFAVLRRRFVSPAVDALGLGLLIALATSIRTNGVLLLATLFLVQVATALIPAAKHTTGPNPAPGAESTPAPARWLATLPYVAFFLAMGLIRVTLPDGESSHIDVLRQITPGKIYYHLTYYLMLPRHIYQGVPYTHLIYLLSLPLAAMGVFRRLRRDYYILIYLTLTYILYVLWPATQGIRFLFPILPFYLSYVLSGMEALLWGRLANRSAAARTIGQLPALAVCLCLAWHSLTLAQDNLARDRHRPDGPYSPPARQLFQFIETSTQPDDVIVTHKPRVMRFYTGRPAYSTPDADALGLADYLVIDHAFKTRQLAPDDLAELTQQGRLIKLYDNATFSVYRVVNDARLEGEPAG